MYQVFSRTWTAREVGRPRRVEVVDTIEQAREACERRNKKLTRKQKADGFKYEFAERGWYAEAFG